ncbi:peptidoglycan-binding domain-containing protein [Caulobacter henricii]|uniref:Peptidoglycan binding-like domain-containing protein n=1 Tax=Caulobacter henricii TaxID=69395 RepID=A0A0P0NWH3_9CAUL|nr:peptidoglycan-binding protein [Caulobacter henricii]ALL12347.1 hypothetical protein AQ619_02635 [Caulobacter henricii]
MPQYSPSRVSAELAFSTPLARGSKNARVKRVQEWLTLQGFALAIDSDFGGATFTQVQAFQARAGLPTTGIVDTATYAALTAPLSRAIDYAPAAGQALSPLVAHYAALHVTQHPREAGGDNLGPWVRAYLGWDGAGARWCAGFACFALEQAAAAVGKPPPIKSSASCDTLADRAKTIGKFISGARIASGQVAKSAITPGSFFLVRASPTDWVHVGVVKSASADAFTTYEGNTNDEGSSNGFEAVERVRGYKDKDFIIW